MRRHAWIAAALVASTAVGSALAGSTEVTIGARNTVLRWGEQATLFGSVSSSKPDEKVVIEVKECGQQSFRDVAWAYSQQGGSWTYDLGARATSQVRAAWNGQASAAVSVRQRPFVSIVIRPGNRGEAGVQGIYPFTGKRVSIQVFDKRSRGWKHVQSVKLTEQGAGGGYIWTSGKFRPRVPRSAQMRGVLTLSQAKPCYLAGYSGIVQT